MKNSYKFALFISFFALACNKAPTPEKSTEALKESPAPVPEKPVATPDPAAEFAFSPPTVQGKVFFINAKDGDVLKGPLSDGKAQVKLQFGVEGAQIAPAGELKANTGHHHLLIDTASVPAGEGVAKDEQHLHFGKGQEEAEIALSPGKHELELSLADGMHRAYGPAWSHKISVTVEISK